MRAPNEIINELYEAKCEEERAKERRVNLESELAQAIGVPDQWEGTKTNTVGRYKVRVSRKMNTRIDADMLRKIAADNMLGMVVEQCFKWKPEIIRKEWDFQSEEHKRIFAPAIVMTPGKVSFAVERTEDK